MPEVSIDKPSSRQVAVAPQESSADIHGVRILVVDDDEDAREMLREVLANAGAVVDTAGSAAEGVDALKRLKPDVLVSDIGMPSEDGYSFLRRVRRLSPTEGGAIPAVALTAYAREEDRVKALSAGYTTHVTKPVTPEVLTGAVANVAFSRGARDPNTAPWASRG
jgi:CheY-like chemotaxis protein